MTTIKTSKAMTGSVRAPLTQGSLERCCMRQGEHSEMTDRCRRRMSLAFPCPTCLARRELCACLPVQGRTVDFDGVVVLRQNIASNRWDGLFWRGTLIVKEVPWKGKLA
jgi:hypothetical protein